MKQRFAKIGVVGLALILLFSTMSITIQLRFCSDNLVETALFSTADPYAMEECKDCCLGSKACCDVEHIVIVGLNELMVPTIVNLQLSKQYYAVKQSSFYINNFETQSKKSFPNKKYIQPTIVVDSQITHQVYLI